YGLGVLAVGSDAPLPMLDFLEAAAADPESVRSYFTALGHRVELIRLMQVVLAQIHQQQAIIDEWKRRTGRPLAGGDHSLKAALAAPGAFTRAVTQDLGNLASDELER